MKLQGLSIIFGLIVIPMVLVLSYFIQLQVDTITLQTSYDTKLLDATHDAMAAFELNTANEDLSSVADSLRTIIDASNNIFVNTLATNLGLSNASKSRIQPYIPSILYTLYDGYYICSPTKKPEVAVDSNGVAVEIDEGTESDGRASGKFSVPGLRYDAGDYKYNNTDNTYYNIGTIPDEDYGQLLYKKDDGDYTTNVNDPNVSYKIEYVLKSYMPYSAKYVDGNTDITINYTLDNYLTIVGNVEDVYYTKSGYLTRNGLVASIKIDGNEVLNGYNENDAENYIKTQNYSNISVEIDDDGDTSTPAIIIQQSGCYKDIQQQIDTLKQEINALNTQLESTPDEATKSIIRGEISNRESAKQLLESDRGVIESIIYYTKSKLFSDWVYNNLGNIQEDHIKEIYSNTIEGTAEKEEGEVVYSFEGKTGRIFDSTTNPESDSSTFANHKFQVIRNSIQYNLNLAMSIYNQTKTSTYDFKMPIISDEQWHKIMTNVSIVSFMEGLNCGLKTYNNYAIVSSTNNELTVTPNEIYFVQKDLFNTENGIYHRIDCPLLDTTQELTSFVSKEVKYDKVYDKTIAKYVYDHKNLACYKCIVDGNYDSENLTNERKIAYYTGVGKQRNNIYKMNAINPSEGYEIIYDSTPIVTNKDSSKNLNEIKKIEVVFGNIRADDLTENVLRLLINGDGFSTETYALNTNQSKEQTITINVNSASNNKINVGTIQTGISNQNTPTSITVDKIQEAIKSIKVVYK